jgi:hypothetical protein
MATITAGEWIKQTVNGYLVGTSGQTAVLPDATSGHASPTITEDLGGKKILVGIHVTVAFANVNSNLIVEGSTDGVNWVQLATASSNTNPHLIGVKLYLVDLTNIRAPYYRLYHNQNGMSLGTSGKLKFIYANG